MDGLAAVEGFLTPVFAFDWVRQDDQTISVVLRDRRRSAKRKRDSVQPQEKTAGAPLSPCILITLRAQPGNASPLT